MRIVSLLGSATEIVHALGLGDRLVAISHECDHPSEALTLPRASRSRFDPAGLDSGQIDAAVRESMRMYGSVYEVDRGMLAELDPDLVLTQAVCEVCAVPTGSVQEAVAGLDREPVVLSLDTHTLGEIIESVRQVASAAGAPKVGERLEAQLRNRLERVRTAVSGRPRPRVLLLEWLEPYFTPGHWVPEMVDLAGGLLLFGSAGQRSREIEVEELSGHDPDLLLIEPCGWDLDEAQRAADTDRHRLTELASRAIDTDNAWLLHSAFFSRSGPRVVDGIESLAAILHPTQFPDGPDPAIARRWRTR